MKNNEDYIYRISSDGGKTWTEIRKVENSSETVKEYNELVNTEVDNLFHNYKDLLKKYRSKEISNVTVRATLATHSMSHVGDMIVFYSESAIDYVDKKLFFKRYKEFKE